ncbi:MAG: tryptophan-rich sensory protein [Candidatus Omnitrophica bacterium]|nr:tryptophan-rich sensory protein [Candidatus Omnitrophota bacterium]
MSRPHWLKLIAALILPQAAGAIGGFFSATNVPTWYPTLLKPSFTPPGWIFGPVWGMLYLMMGVAFFFVLISEQSKDKVRFAAGLFCVHLLLNTLWSILFFGMRNPFLAFIDIIVLWLMITALFFIFWRIRRLAGALMIPYWLWVSFAGVLNYSIWRMN